MLALVRERDLALQTVARLQQRIADLFGPEAGELDARMTALHQTARGPPPPSPPLPALAIPQDNKYFPYSLYYSVRACRPSTSEFLRAK